MIISLLVFCLNIVVGLIIPFRQHRNGLFLFFLIAGIADPVNFCLNYFWDFDRNTLVYLYNVVSYIITIFYIKRHFGPLYSFIVLILICFIPLFWFNILFDVKTQIGIQVIYGSTAVSLGLISCNLLIIMSRNIFFTRRLNLYFLLLVMLSVITFLRTLTFSLKFEVGVEYYIIAYFIEAVIGIYFIFFDIKNSPQIPLAGKKANAEAVES